LDDEGNSIVPNNPVRFETCVGNLEQEWTIEPNGTIQLNKQNYCLDTSGESTAIGTPVVLNPCSASDTTQQWTVGLNLELVNTGATAADGQSICLDDPGFNAADGQTMQIYLCNGGNNQAWWLPTV
jgi:hypothetical protein